ncbi:hypothetical protein RQP46_008263 [Phenoliferia psychrophenolica]
MSSSTAPAPTPTPAATAEASSYAKANAPSRAAVTSTGKKGKKGGNKGDVEKPDYISPEPKNAAERRDWDRMSTRMEGFHSYFRQSFQQMWEMADKVGENGVSLREYLAFCEDFRNHLDGHHGIEERHIFPVLAKRLPEFGEDHPKEHEKIHEGIDRFNEYIRKCKAQASVYSPDDFKKVLASFGPILMYHLDAEVETLKSENLRRYYTRVKTTHNYWIFQRMRSTVFPEVIPGVAFFTAISVAICVASDYTNTAINVDVVMLSVLTTMLSFAISLRVSSASDRFTEGRRAWSSITLNSRSLALLFWIHGKETTLNVEQLAQVTPEQLEVEKLKGLVEKRTMINLVEGFAVATKASSASRHYLRGEPGVYYEDLYHLVAALPKYSFPSSVESTEDENILGLWRHPGEDGKTVIPVNKRRPNDGTVQSSASRSTFASSAIDLEKGLPKPTYLDLAPASNPPANTLYHYCPPLLIFRPILRLFSTRADTSRRSLKKQRKERAPNANVPLQIALFLQGYVNKMITRGTLEPPMFGTFLAPLQSLQDCIATLERVLTTPLPFAYASHLRFSVYIHKTLGYLTIVGEAVAATMFLGFMELGQQLEQPFGYDDSDLDLDHFCELIGSELAEIVAHPCPDLDWVFTEDNLPFGPDDGRSAVSIVEDRVAGIRGFHKDLAKKFHSHSRQGRAAGKARSVEMLSV